MRAAESTLAAIGRIADEAPSAQELLETVADRIHRVVPHDGAFFSTTDPDTTLVNGLGILTTNLPLNWCQPTWDYEMLVPDALKFADIARSDRAVADLHDATGGRPDRSPRFRHFASDTGMRAEVRMAFTVGDAAWGIAQINRAGTGARFSDDEKAWLERVAPHVARGLRRTLLTTPSKAAVRGPGVVVLDRGGAVVSTTPEAREWLAELNPALLTGGGPDLPLPFHAHGFAVRVRAAHEDGEPRLHARLRTRNGVWVLMHGSPLQGSDLFALIIEPAKASDVAPLIVEAYGLTVRELDVTRAIARGLKTAEIAAHLHLSPHTVRDHVKAVFEKVGVSSRGELVHKVFAEHYAAAH